jgi:pilus assembly protein CpaC
LRSDKNVGNVLVAVNKSQIIDVDRSFSEITIGNPKIADVIPLSKRSVYVFGKKLGTTSLTLSGAGGAVIAVVDLTVSFDIGALKSQIFDLVPGQKIEVRPAADGLVLSGQVGSATQMERVLAIARRHAGENVTNLIAVTGSQQVMLQLHFAEVDRRQAKLFGISTDLLYQNGNDLINIGTGDGVSTDPESFGSSLITLVSGDFSGTFLLDFLEEKGALRTLAEPNLIALSGDTARFLAGGEFPIPVGQDFDGGRRDITIEFKEFGISLSFTPTVLADGLINLELFSEVSQIDPDNSIQLENLVIPGLEVRRAKTTVEVGNGQAFAIAGLLRENFKDDVRQIPLLGDLPVLGALFRSAAYQSGLTELVIVVTPYLVQPTTPAQLASPNDSFIAPNAEELFLLGRTEGQPRQPVKSESEDSSAELHRTLVGGIVGPHGYILR